VEKYITFLTTIISSGNLQDCGEVCAEKNKKCIIIKAARHCNQIIFCQIGVIKIKTDHLE
jgi:hypothetical protein